MSFRDDTRPQDTGPERLNPAQGAPTLEPSVEATGRASDPCTGHGSPHATRARILVWLAEGSREVTWALCSLSRERWTETPPSRLSDWPAMRHVRHIALREKHLTLPLVRQALGASEPLNATLEFEQADATWDAVAAGRSAESILDGFGETRFELQQLLESAPDEVWERSISASRATETSGPVQLEWLLLNARVHELEHLAAIWRIALHWDRAARAPIPLEKNVPLHPADRLEESH